MRVEDYERENIINKTKKKTKEHYQGGMKKRQKRINRFTRECIKK